METASERTPSNNAPSQHHDTVAMGAAVSKPPKAPVISSASSDIDNTGSRLVDLPAELYNRVCDFAPSRELKALRASCKQLYHNTQDTFEARLFATLEINIDEHDLKYAMQVAQSKYAGVVRTLSIRPRFYLSRTYPYHLEERLVDSEMKLRLEEQSQWLSSGKDIEYLAKAISGFKALDRIDIEATNTPAASKAIHGIPRTYRGVWGPRDTPTDALGYAFRMVDYALSKSTTRVRELRAGAIPVGILRTSIEFTALSTDTFRLDHFAKLQELHLVLGVPTGHTGVGCEARLADFLQHATGLRVLHFSFWHFNLEWMREVFDRITLPKLESFRLEAMRKVDAHKLSNFLERHSSSLRTLELVNMFFDTDDLSTAVPRMLENLRLHGIKLQQLCGLRTGLLLFGTEGDLVCDACREDSFATWQFEKGPGCIHATLKAEGEVEVIEEMKRLSKTAMLPWPMRSIAEMPIADPLEPIDGMEAEDEMGVAIPSDWGNVQDLDDEDPEEALAQENERDGLLDSQILSYEEEEVRSSRLARLARLEEKAQEGL